MSDLAAQLIAALKDAANTDAGAEAPLVSVSMEFVGEGNAEISASIVRRTRTLVFAAAEAKAASGALVATASSVHRIKI